MSAVACPMCGAPVHYAKWRVGAGVAELEPSTGGLFIIDRDGFCREAKDGERNRMTSHYATCKRRQAEQQKTAKAAGGQS